MDNAMESRPAVSFVDVSARIAGLYMRRFANRLFLGLRRGKTKSAERTGTARKRTGNPLGVVAIVVVFLFNSANIASEALKAVSAELGPARDVQGRVKINDWIYGRLEGYGRDHGNPAFEGGPIPFEDMRRAGFERQEFALGELLARDSQSANTKSRADYAHALAQVYEARGIGGFVPVTEPAHWPLDPILAWQDPALCPQLLCAMGVMLLILAGARHCWTLGSRNQDLGQVEWSTEWLFTLPASSRALFGAQIVGHALVDPFSWVGTIPLLLVMYRSSGCGGRWRRAWRWQIPCT